jgi:hypothetical protein
MRGYQRPGLKGRKFEHFFLVECENASESPIIDNVLGKQDDHASEMIKILDT